MDRGIACEQTVMGSINHYAIISSGFHIRFRERYYESALWTGEQCRKNGEYNIMRIGSLMIYVTMTFAALLCICVTVLSLITGDCTVSTVGALFIGSMALGAVPGVSVLKYVPAYVSGLVLVVGLVAGIACVLAYTELSMMHIIAACIGSGLVTGAGCGSLGGHFAMRDIAL